MSTCVSVLTDNNTEYLIRLLNMIKFSEKFCYMNNIKHKFNITVLCIHIHLTSVSWYEHK